MGVRKIKTSWWVDFRAGGQRIRKRSPENTRAGAQAFEVLIRQRLVRGEPPEGMPEAPKRPVMLLKDFAPEWVETYVKTNNKPTTQRSKDVALRVHLLPWFGKFRLEEITSIEIERYKSAKQKQGLSPKTINDQVGVLTKCLRCAIDWGLLMSLPRSTMLRVPPQPFDFLTPVESHNLLQDTQEPIWHEMLLVALRTGMRLGELIGLDWSAVSLERRMITVRQSIIYGQVSSPKNNRMRHIPATDEVVAALSYRRKSSGLVFPRPDGEPFAYNTVNLAIKRHCKRVGLRPIGWHVLRHTFASQLATEGIPMRVIQDLLGHSSILMTVRYAHLAPNTLHISLEVLQMAEKRELLNVGQQVVNQRLLLSAIGG